MNKAIQKHLVKVHGVRVAGYIQKLLGMKDTGDYSQSEVWDKKLADKGVTLYQHAVEKDGAFCVQSGFRPVDALLLNEGYGFWGYYPRD